MCVYVCVCVCVYRVLRWNIIRIKKFKDLIYCDSNRY